MKNEICSPVIIDLKAGIYTIDESNITFDTVPLKIDLDSVYALTMEGHNLLINTVQIENISFPLNDGTNESSFVLSIGEVKDTISFSYEKELHFISAKCGVYYTYSIINIEHSTHYLKGIVLINPKINVVSAENIHLVF